MSGRHRRARPGCGRLPRRFGIPRALEGGSQSDLEHPARFWMVLLKPQWQSWLVRGGFIITGYGAVLALHLAAVFAGRADLTPAIGWIGAALAVPTAVYTAYLLAQARARDLWQSPLLPAHLLAQAVVAGAAAVALLTLADGNLEPASVTALRAGLVVHLVLALGEASMRHPTAHAALAAKNMIAGPFAHFYWVGLALALLGVLVGSTSPLIASSAALTGLLLYEHAYVQAGQSVPLA